MRRTLIVALTGVSFVAFTDASMAQEAASQVDDASVTNVIIVQARRKDESIQDVPVSVQAVTSQELTKLNIREFTDVQTLVPGLSITKEANGIGGAASLRGIAYDGSASGNNGTVEFYMNDAPLSAAILYQSMFDVGQIEVLRGPQGTLRGRASPSGSITVTTRRPDLVEPGAYMLGTLNSIGGWNLNGAVNVPVIADKLAVRVAGIVDESNDSRVHSLYNDTDPSQETHGIRASVQAEPFDALTLFFAYTSTERKVTTFDQVESANIADPSAPASPVFIAGSDRRSVMASPRTYEQRFQVLNWQAELRLLGQKLNYVGSRNIQNYNSLQPDDIGGFYGPQFPDEITAAGTTTRTKAIQENHELRLSSDERVAGIFDYVVGYQRNNLDSPTDVTSETLVWLGEPQASLANLRAHVRTPVKRLGGSREESFFGNLTAHLGDATELSGGIRRIKYRSFGSLAINGVTVPAANEDRTTKTTIFQFSAKQRFNDNVMAYASFGTSWRPGSSTNATIQRNNIAPTALQQSLLFPDDEKSKSYEIGFKTNWLDNRLTANVTAFHQTFKNYSYFSRNTYIAETTVNGPQIETLRGIAVGVPAKVDGIEAEFGFQATPEWNLGLVAAYAKSKIKGGDVPCNDYFPADGVPDTTSQVPTYAQIMAATNGGGVALCRVNSRAGLNAPFSATFQTEYQMPISSSANGYLRGLTTFYGNSQNDPTNPYDDIKAYALVNLFAGVRAENGGWEVGGYVKNVFDTERALYRSGAPWSITVRAPGASNRVSTYRPVTYSAPREFGLTARFALGSR